MVRLQKQNVLQGLRRFVVDQSTLRQRGEKGRHRESGNGNEMARAGVLMTALGRAVTFVEVRDLVTLPSPAFLIPLIIVGAKPYSSPSAMVKSGVPQDRVNIGKAEAPRNSTCIAVAANSLQRLAKGIGKLELPTFTLVLHILIKQPLVRGIEKSNFREASSRRPLG